jgi:hypothetical protein
MRWVTEGAHRRCVLERTDLIPERLNGGHRFSEKIMRSSRRNLPAIVMLPPA